MTDSQFVNDLFTLKVTFLKAKSRPYELKYFGAVKLHAKNTGIYKNTGVLPIQIVKPNVGPSSEKNKANARNGRLYSAYATHYVYINLKSSASLVKAVWGKIVHAIRIHSC